MGSMTAESSRTCCIRPSGKLDWRTKKRTATSSAILLLAGLVWLGNVAISGALDARYVSAVFETPYTNGSFRKLTVNKQTQNVYVSAVDYLYSLDPDLDLQVEAVTGPKLDNIGCVPLPLASAGGSACSHKYIWTNNYNKIMLVDYVNEHLITCGTLYQGICEKRFLSNFTLVEPPNYNSPVVNVLENSSALAIIAPGPRDDVTQTDVNVMYVAETFRLRNGFTNIPPLCSRKLSDFKLAYDNRNDYTQSSLKFDRNLRDNFLVTYLHGFSSTGFSYFLTRQPRGVNNKEEHSVLIRLCQQDKAYRSYTEVPLACSKGEVTYNLMLAATVGTAGRKLALSLGVSLRSKVIYAAFDAGQDSPEAALCVFSLDQVNSVITEAWKKCFAGEGYYAGEHLKVARKCSINTEMEIDGNYCGQVKTNNPLGISTPIVADALITFSEPKGSNRVISALGVGITHEYTVAFAGTRDGHVMKISVDSNTSANRYETVPISPGEAFKKDVAFDEEGEHLYLLTQTKVLKMRVEDCGRYTTCVECLQAKDPYCGWCSLENKCSPRKECQASDLPLRWLSYTSDQCPHINRVQPSQIPRDKERLLTLDIRNLPDFQTNAAYRCRFSPIASDSSDRDAIEAPYASEANRTRDTFQCYTPPMAKLPPFETGSDAVEMTLSVIVNGQELVSEKVVFFDCGLHTSCTACTLSQNSCSWCINNHMCTDNTDKHCNTDDYVVGLGSKAVSTSGLRGPEKCPRFESAQGTEILVGAGLSPHVQVTALGLQPAYQLSTVRCQFVMDDVKEVNAMVENVPGTDRYNITCNSELFTYVRESPTQNVAFKVLWGGADNPLDNPQGVKVVMYKCGVMAKTCGDCFTVDERYKCGWCDTKRCSTAQFCEDRPGGFLLARKGAICPNPLVTKIYPKSGPLGGGTKVTIEGQNLGTNRDEVTVHIGSYKCAIVEFEAPRRIVCQTPKTTSFSHSAPLRLVIGKDQSQTVMADSSEPFSFVQPRLTDISPIAGVAAGGTIVTLLGEHLDAGSERTVTMGQNPCADIKSLNSTALTCVTTAITSVDQLGQGLSVELKIDNEQLMPPGVVFTYVQNPNVTWLSRHEVIQGGGLVINVSGENLQNVQNPRILIWHQDVAYSEMCRLSRAAPSTNMSCLSPNVSGLQPEDFSGLAAGVAGLKYIELDIGFEMDAVKPLLRASHLGKVRVYRDPVVETFPGSKALYQPSQRILIIKANHLEPLKPSDVRVQIGQEVCEIKSVAGDIITCEPPDSEPAALVGSGFPEVTVIIGETEHLLGVLRYEKQEELSEEAMFVIIAFAILFFILIIVGSIYCLIRFRRNDDMMKKMRKDMDQLESRVANECKDAFAELQTDMSQLTSDLSGGGSIPFWDYRTYCMRVLFPPDCNDHAVIKELELDYHNREDMERGLQLFFNLIRNKTFLLIFIRTLESNNDFHLRDRVNVASLISVTLQTQMEYATEILKTLLADLIEKTVENPKAHAKLLLRRNESVAEKMLTNWFTFLLYKFLKECAGEPLFMLYGAIKQQVSKGPVDAITGEARYSLSEDKLLRQHINYRHMVLHVMDIDVDRCSQPAYPVKVLDCDTISQVKEKILDAIYKSAPFSSRPPKEELDLEWIVGDKSEIPMKMFPNKETKRLVLSDEDHTTKSEGDCKRLNTLSHYKVPDGAYVALHPKQTSIYNMSIMSEKSKYSENSFYNRSPSQSLNRSLNAPNVQLDVEGCKVYHLVRHQDVESNSKEGERGSKMVTEIYLPRLLVTKGTLQTFVDDLFERIFSTTHRGTVMPLATKYMFDFLDDQAMLHNMGDDVVHTWKSNSLPLRFWVNVIKNPNFAFDIYKSNIVDACLTVIGQTFMDCCSTLEHKLTKESPSGKLLYAKDIPKYKQWVASYYQDIKIMPAISDQDMTAMLAEESRAHCNEFNTNAALLELWKYVKKYYDDIVTALEDDEFAKKSRLTHKLDEVANAMDGTAC